MMAKQKQSTSSAEKRIRADTYWRLCTALIACHAFGFSWPPKPAKRIRKNVAGHWGANPGIAWIVGALGAHSPFPKPIKCFVGTGHATSYLLADALVRDGLNTDAINRRIERYCVPGGDPSELFDVVADAGVQFGELGPALAVSQGYARSRPDEIVACVIGDGELETPAALAALCHARKILSSDRYNWIPIINANQWKLGSEACFRGDTLRNLVEALGFRYVETEADPASTETGLQQVFDGVETNVPVLWTAKSQKGWPIPEDVFTNRYRGHAAHKPPRDLGANDLGRLSAWLSAYAKHVLSDPSVLDKIIATADGVSFSLLDGTLVSRIQGQAPKPPADRVRDWRVSWVCNEVGSAVDDELHTLNVAIFSPDEAKSNRLHRCTDSGQVTEILSEETAFSWAVGTSTAGVPAAFSSYEAFAPLIASQYRQLGKVAEFRDRTRCAPLGVFITSLSWANSPSHQNTDFMATVLTAASDAVRTVFPIGAGSARRWTRQLFMADSCSLFTVVYSKGSVLDLDCRGENAVVVSAGDLSNETVYIVAVGDIAVQEAVRAMEFLSRTGRDVAVMAIVDVGAFLVSGLTFIKAVSDRIALLTASFNPDFINGKLFQAAGRVCPVTGMRDIPGATMEETLEKNKMDHASIIASLAPDAGTDCSSPPTRQLRILAIDGAATESTEGAQSGMVSNGDSPTTDN